MISDLCSLKSHLNSFLCACLFVMWRRRCGCRSVLMSPSCGRFFKYILLRAPSCGQMGKKCAERKMRFTRRGVLGKYFFKKGKKERLKSNVNPHRWIGYPRDGPILLYIVWHGFYKGSVIPDQLSYILYLLVTLMLYQMLYQICDV